MSTHNKRFRPMSNPRSSQCSGAFSGLRKVFLLYLWRDDWLGLWIVMPGTWIHRRQSGAITAFRGSEVSRSLLRATYCQLASANCPRSGVSTLQLPFASVTSHRF